MQIRKYHIVIILFSQSVDRLALPFAVISPVRQMEMAHVNGIVTDTVSDLRNIACAVYHLLK